MSNNLWSVGINKPFRNEGLCFLYPTGLVQLKKIKMKNRMNLGLVLIMSGLLAISCSSSRITNSWTPAGKQPQKFSKVMVAALIGGPERDLRQKMEEHITGDLQTNGINAISAYAVYGPKAFNGDNEKALLEQLKNDGVEAVLTVVLLDKEKERYYVPGQIYYTPYMIYYNRFWGYYRTIYDRVYTPGYYAVDTKYFWETNLYDLSDMTILYSAQTQSFDPASAESLAHEYGKLISKDLLGKKVLQ